MKKDSLNCYVIPAQPIPLLLPIECIAAVVVSPKIELLSQSKTNWMLGHITWENQRVPVLSFSGLHDSKLNEAKKTRSRVVVLNPIPDSTRKAYTGLLCFGGVKKINITDKVKESQLPKNMDKRYVEAVIKDGKNQYIIPKLSALGVAFSYF